MIVDEVTLEEHTKLVMHEYDKLQRTKAKAKKAKRKQAKASRRKNTH